MLVIPYERVLRPHRFGRTRFDWAHYFFSKYKDLYLEAFEAAHVRFDLNVRCKTQWQQQE